MDYLNQKDNFYYELYLFTSIEPLNAFLLENRMEVLLISECALEKISELASIPNLFLLSEVRDNLEGVYPSIFKFQSAERIFSSIIAFLDRGVQPLNFGMDKENAVNFYGIISSNGGSGKTTFSLALAEALAREKRTLYISFELLKSSFLGEEQNGSMSDVIYFLKQRQKGILMKIQSMATIVNGVDCIFPVTHYGDLLAIEEGDMDYLFEELTKTLVYQNVIFDFGMINDMAFYILEHCQIVYETQLRELFKWSKEQALKHIFLLKEKEILLKRVIPLSLPIDAKIADGTYPIEQLLEGKLGKFIDELLQ